MAAPDPANGLTPEALLERFRREGHPADVAALFDATAPDLFRLALHLVPDAATAEDVLQETFLAVMEHADAYEPGRPAMPWLTGVLRNQAGSARRRQARRPDPERLAIPPEVDDPAARAADAEEKERLHGAMLRLEEPYRGVALLRWRYGLEPAAIAEVRGVPPGTVRSLLHRALQKLRVEMGALPALFLAFRPQRGIEGVRRAVLRRAAAHATASAGAAAASAVAVTATGGLVMANKALAAVAIVAVMGAAGWFALRPDAGAPSTPAVPVNVVRSDTKPPVPAPVPTRPEPDAATVSIEGLPPPVDLEKCDRDLDLFGVVVGDAGTPVPGAIVECVRFPWRGSKMAEPGRHWDEVVGPRTRSAVDGTFALRLPRGRMVDLRGTASDYGQGEIPQCQAGERVRLVLRRLGGTLSVRTVDDAKRPVGGVRLRLWGQMGIYGTIRYLRVGVTGADGRFEFSRLEGGRASLSAQHDELGQPAWLRPEIPESGTLPVELVMPAGRVVLGRVLDASTGKPVPGARVGSNWVMDRPVATDAEGRYRFPGWTSGSGNGVLTAAAPGYGSVMRRVPEEGDLDFTLEPGFRATGRVVDAAGESVPGARVVTLGWWKDGDTQGSDRVSCVAEADGRFVLDGLTHRADHDLVVEADGHGRTYRSFGAPAAAIDEKDLGDVALPAARAIEGRALDVEGRPFARQAVNVAMMRPAEEAARDRDKTYYPGMGELRHTDDLGRFRFPDLSPGRHRLILTVDRSPRVEVEVDLPPDRDLLDVVIRQGGRSVTLLVTDLAGKPLEGILVQTNVPTGNAAAGGVSSTVQVQTGADGRAGFRSLPESNVTGERGLRFSVQPFSGESAPPYAWHTTDPILPEGQEVKIALKPAAMIRGRVLGPDGETIPELYVNAFDATGKGCGAGACDTNGGFSIRVPAGEPLTIRVPGHMHVNVDKGSTMGTSPYRAEREGVVAPASDLLLRARRVGSEGAVEVLVLDLEGRPVPDFDVGLMRDNEPRQPAAKTDATGRARLEGLLEDAWHLAPRSPVPSGFPAEAVVPAAAEVVPSGQQVVLRFRRGIPLEGSVVKPDGSPAPEAHVYAQFRWGIPMVRTKSDEGGRFRLLFGEGDEAFVLTAMWWDEEKKAFKAELRNVKAEGNDLVLKLEPAKPR